MIIILLTVVAATALTSKLTAQYSIPSFDVPVIADPTTFEESPISNAIGFGNITMGFVPVKNPVNREERIIVVKAIDKDVATNAWADIIIYSLDYSISYGPYTVNEGNLFEMGLSEEYEWGVEVVDASQGCEMSVWYE